MIYVSTSCIKENHVGKAIEVLANNGFKNIELSGGTSYYEGYYDDLLRLKDKYQLSYTIHNYFPPPKEHFVFNLASLSNEIYNKSLDHAVCAINLAKKLNIQRIGFHAGFFADLKPTDLGRNLLLADFLDKESSVKRFFNAMNVIEAQAQQIKVYFENNVITKRNLELYNNIVPFMLTRADEYLELKTIKDFNLLLDIAHLKVSANTFGISFASELDKMIQHSEYLHLSDNDGVADQNKPITVNSDIYRQLTRCNLEGKAITLEVYDSIEKIKETYNLISNLIVN